MSFQDCTATVEIGGVEYLCREHRYTATVLRLADNFSVTIPAPNGEVLGADGSTVKIADAAPLGALVRFYLADPNVNGGVKVLKLVGRVTSRRLQSDPQSGTVLAVGGADLGWHLSMCAEVHRNLRGVKWRDFLATNAGLTIDPTGKVLADKYGFGFAGVRGGNLINRRIRLGRAGAQSDFQQEIQPTIQEPRFQSEAGQTIDSIMIQFAKLDHFLVNVSADGWLQYFYPADSGSGKPYTAKPLYSFYHYPASDSRKGQNNVIGAVLYESADPIYTRVQCWSSVVDTTENDPTDPNAGTYYGEYNQPDALPFYRFYTFTDGEQMGQDRVNARAKWQQQRGVFDAWTYTFETAGHSQNGAPFVEDTLCELHDLVYGIEGLFYVSAVEPTRKLARPGADTSGAGTRCKITLKKSGLLAA